MDEETKFIDEILKQYPKLDRMMAKTLYDCYIAGTLDKLIEERKALGKFIPEKPDNYILKNITID